MEPITLAVVGATALTEGVKFLYSQAGEAIKWWRERRDDPDPAPLSVPADAPLEGHLEPATVDRDAMGRLENEIRDLRAALGAYVDDVAPEPVDPADQDLIAVVDGLRRALEAVLGQRIRLKGEPGDPSARLRRGKLDVDSVAGYVAGVRARSIEGGHVRGTLRVKTVDAGGKAIAVDVDSIGGR